jgi:hypothetical protein
MRCSFFGAVWAFISIVQMTISATQYWRQNLRNPLPRAAPQAPRATRRTRSSHRPPATGPRPPATGHRPQATGHRPQATGHRPPATGHRPQATGHRPQATGHRPPATGHRPPATRAERGGGGPEPGGVRSRRVRKNFFIFMQNANCKNFFYADRKTSCYKL